MDIRRGLAAVAFLAAIGSPGAAAQSSASASVTGAAWGSTGDGAAIEISFQCTGIPNCIGTFVGQIQDHGCSNFVEHDGRIEFAGLDLSRTGPLQGTVTVYDATTNMRNPDGTCTAPGEHLGSPVWIRVGSRSI